MLKRPVHADAARDGGAEAVLLDVGLHLKVGAGLRGSGRSRRPVGLGGRNLDVADPGDAGELEQDVRAVDVRDDEAARREAGRVEVRLGSEVDDRLAAVGRSRGGDRVRHVALHELVRDAFEPREAPEIRQAVEHDGLVPAATRRFTKSLPRKPAPPGTRTRTPRP